MERVALGKGLKALLKNEGGKFMLEDLEKAANEAGKNEIKYLKEGNKTMAKLWGGFRDDIMAEIKKQQEGESDGTAA